MHSVFLFVLGSREFSFAAVRLFCWFAMAQVKKKLTQTTWQEEKKGLFFAAADPDTDYFRVNEALWKTAEETSRQKF